MLPCWVRATAYTYMKITCIKLKLLALTKLCSIAYLFSKGLHKYKSINCFLPLTDHAKLDKPFGMWIKIKKQSSEVCFQLFDRDLTKEFTIQRKELENST